ncbi:MAG: hypothetical protein ACKV2Q_13015 [Planctomycetaceae bacterium]
MTERHLFQPTFRSHRRWLALCGTFVLALGTTFVSGALEDAKPAQPSGLRGILPPEVPAAVNEQAFEVLDGNWKEWGEATAIEVTKLYSDESLDLAGQRLQLEILKRKLHTMEISLKDARYRGIHESLGSLYAALNRRVTVAEAVLDTLTLDPQKAVTERLDGARQDVAQSLKNLESELNAVKNGPAWLSYVRSAEITKLVSDKKGSEAVPVLTAVHEKLLPSEATSPELKKFLDGAKFVALRQSLDNFVKLVAVVDQPINPEKLRAELVNLVDSVEKFEKSQSTADAAAVRKAFETIRKVSPDQGNRIASAMATHYFNFNLRVVASEKFLSKLIGETTTKQGQVREQVMEANVSGNQTTTATVGIDLKPNNNGIRLNLLLDGLVRSSTVGVTTEAQVQTSGYHVFKATKPLTFDGDKFATGPAQVSVWPSNTTLGVSTKYSGAFLIGGIADSIARDEVAKRRGQSEAIAAERVRNRVTPEFNQEVDTKIADLNKDLEEKVNAKLREKDLMPSATNYRTTEDDLRANLRLMADRELAGGDGPFVTVPNTGFVVALHESLLNNSLDRLKFAGRSLTDKQLAEEIEKSFSDLLGRPINATQKIETAGEGAKEPATFIFPDADPIRIRLNNGQLTLVISAGLKQEEGKEDIPTQKITVPLMFRVEGTKLVIESGDVEVAPVGDVPDRTTQITRAKIMGTKIKSALPPRSFDRFINIDKNRQTPIHLGVAQVKASGGWLSLAFE